MAKGHQYPNEMLMRFLIYKYMAKRRSSTGSGNSSSSSSNSSSRSSSNISSSSINNSRSQFISDSRTAIGGRGQWYWAKCHQCPNGMLKRFLLYI